jgi:diguanylate cyclase (GGDEF)-like protein
LEHYSPCLINIRLVDTLKKQSIRDSLTGLFNRRYLEGAVEREISRLERRGLELGIIMLDVDHFKSFNDIYGHATGDAVLRALGAYLQKSIREEDIACRYGGEEFVLILPEASLEVTYERAEKIREGVKNKVSVTGKNEMLSVSISLGVSVYPKHGKTSAELIGMADSALYKAKAGGRDRTVKAE